MKLIVLIYNLLVNVPMVPATTGNIELIVFTFMIMYVYCLDPRPNEVNVPEYTWVVIIIILVVLLILAIAYIICYCCKKYCEDEDCCCQGCCCQGFWDSFWTDFFCDGFKKGNFFLCKCFSIFAHWQVS